MLAILLRLHFFVGIVQPIVGDVIHALQGLLAVRARGESGEHLVIGVGRLGILVLETEAFGLVIAGLFGSHVGVLGVLGDVVVDSFGLGVFAAAEELVGAGQVTLGRAFGAERFRFELVAVKDQAVGRSRRRLGRVKEIELVPLPDTTARCTG